MLPKCTVLFLVIVAVKSANLQGRNIPVEVRYERLEHNIDSNLKEKIQLSENETKQNTLRLEELSNNKEDLVPLKDHQNSIRNFNEKVQLSPEELLQSSKHIPIHHSIKDDEKNNLVSEELRGESIPEIKSDNPSKATLLQQAQHIIENGIESLKENFHPKETEVVPTKELWEKLETDVKEYLTQENNQIGLRQQGTNPQNIFQNVANGFQQITNNFIQQFTNQNNNGTAGDEGQTQGPIQGFVGYFTGGVQNIVSNIQNIGQVPRPSGNSTVLGDTGTDQQPGNIFGTIITNVQQLFQPSQVNNGGNGTQGDNTGPANGGTSQGFFAGAISQINQVVNNIIPTSQVPPIAQNDDGTNTSATNQPGGPIQQVVQTFGNIGSAIGQFIQNGGQQSSKPPGSEDENTSPPQNQNFIQSIGQNLGNAFQNIQNQFRPPGSPAKPAVEGIDDGNSNPIIGQVANIGNQLQPLAGLQSDANPVQNLIPGSSSSAGKQPTEEKPEESSIPVATEDKNKIKKVEKNEKLMTATE